MAGQKKRGAGTYLTDQNWDTEEEEADAAEPFKQASEDVLAKRTFKKAARRVNPSEKGKVSNPFSAFGGFGGGGFGAKTSTLATHSTGPFSFGSKPTNTLTTFNSPATKVADTNGGDPPPTNPFFVATAAVNKPKFLRKQKGEEKDTVGFSFTDNLVTSETKSTVNDQKCKNSKDLKGEVIGIATNKVEEQNSEESQKDEANLTNKDNETGNKTDVDELVSLNTCLLTWIEKHIEENACVDLSPVFADYEKHLKKLSI